MEQYGILPPTRSDEEEDMRDTIPGRLNDFIIWMTGFE